MIIRNILAVLALTLTTTAALAADRPNILWVTCEDTSPHLGCYGDPLAKTPNLDAFAREAVRYTRAFAYTGVCAPSRSCLITGVYPLRLGSQHMRSTTRLPESIKCFPEYLRAAGYYCTNNVKEDYNFRAPKEAWDESSAKAHWRNRPAGKPFFAVFNSTVSHQSKIFGPDLQAEQKGLPPPPTDHDPAAVKLPPFHPDTPEFRREWARHFDNVTRMDELAGDVLRELKEDGLEEDTIVFYFSDHGTGMPAVKMWAWGPSLQVPMMIRFPAKWKDFAPAAPGETTDRLVSFVDFAPTVLSLCGLDIPAYMQGIAFLGTKAGPPREFIFGGKDRQGENADMVRYVRDGKYQYNRNFMPHLPYGQYMSYLWQHASMRKWDELHRAGKLSGIQDRFLADTKPVEELYDVEADPWQANNLALDANHRADLERMRALLIAQMKAAGDLSLLPEREMHTRAAASTPYEIAMDPALNPIDKLLAAAELANAMDPVNIPELVKLLGAEDSALRWWGATGLVALKEKAAPATDALRKALNDESPDVRVAAAEALANLGSDDEALAALRKALKDESVFVRLAALTTARRMGMRAAPLLPAIQKAGMRDPAHKDASDYVGRMVEYLPGMIGGAE